MPIIPFGKGDLLALPKISNQSLVFGEEVRYTKPTYDFCYSQFGFIVPLNATGRSLSSFLEDTSLVYPPAFVNVKENHFYFRIDSKGNLWNVLVVEDGDNYTLRQQNIFVPDKSWWLANNAFDITVSSNLLLGFLATNPTQKKIDEFYSKYNHGSNLEYFSIKEIAENINTKFTTKEQNEDDLILKKIKKILNKKSSKNTIREV